MSLFYPLNPALAYPFTYPLFQSSDIFYQQFKGIIAHKNIFVKVKNISENFISRPYPSFRQRGVFCVRLMAKHPQDGALAWWVRSDEPQPDKTSNEENLDLERHIFSNIDMMTKNIYFLLGRKSAT